MQDADVDIHIDALHCLQRILEIAESYQDANSKIEDICGIVDFFASPSEMQQIGALVTEKESDVSQHGKTEYGDYQTPLQLAEQVVALVVHKGISPEVVIEPTCGKGNFVLAAIKAFPSLQEIIAIEVYKPYLFQAKMNLLHYYLSREALHKPRIRFLHQNIFNANIQSLKKTCVGNKVLILGNPPWVTNSALGAIDAANLPRKSNFKNVAGLDAMTGKGNFDIGEYITLMLLDSFVSCEGHCMLLLKNSVIRNIVSAQRQSPRPIAEIESYTFDARSEFGIAADASAFFCRLHQLPAKLCRQFDLYSGAEKNTFGWENNKFIADWKSYAETELFDGVCSYQWRQGVKHDAAKVMELEKISGGIYQNGLGEEIHIEDDIIYPLLKSSDLYQSLIPNARKYTILPQRFVGEQTSYIADSYPLTYSYLQSHLQFFEKRKSSIYRNKPPFSIFGIGKYSFMPYKVAISGLYKEPRFVLVLPENNKAAMLDDTCYFIGFDCLNDALCALVVCNHVLTRKLLAAITFFDSKRIYTKEVLMRMDIALLSQYISYSDALQYWKIPELRELPSPSQETWDSFVQKIQHTNANFGGNGQTKVEQLELY